MLAPGSVYKRVYIVLKDDDGAPVCKNMQTKFSCSFIVSHSLPESCNSPSCCLYFNIRMHETQPVVVIVIVIVTTSNHN